MFADVGEYYIYSLDIYIYVWFFTFRYSFELALKIIVLPVMWPGSVYVRVQISAPRGKVDLSFVEQ